MVFLRVLLCCLAFSTAEILEDSREAVSPEHLDWLLEKENYEEFNRLMRIDIPHLSRPRTANETHHPRFSPYLEHGDILLTPEQKAQGRQASSNPNMKWRSFVPYQLSSKFTQKERNIILAGLKQLNSHLDGCLHVVPRKSEKDYVFVFKGNGCYSNLGKTGGQQPLSLEQPGCGDVATVVHEFMHALAFVHEHCRPDRDEHIRMLWSNINKDWQSQFDKASAKEVSSYGDYDPYSVMHYPVRHPDVSNNKPCFEFKDSSVVEDDVGYAEDASDIDIEKLQNLYC